MIRSINVALLVTAFAISLAATAAAQEGKPPVDQAKMMAELQKQMLAKFDTNKDGVLGDAEKLAAQEAMRGLAGAAGAGAVPGGFPGVEQFMQQFDRDRDGRLSDIEKAAAWSAYQKMRGSGAVQRGPGVGGVPAGGTNVPAAGQGDGKPNKVSPLVKRFDLDGDGKLNDAEKAAAQAEFNKKKGKADKPEKKPE
jgi:hypothetical protein